MFLESDLKSFELTGNQLESGYQEVKVMFNHQGKDITLNVDAVLFAVGRQPNVEGMNLE